jgi:DNA polymerase-1
VSETASAVVLVDASGWLFRAFHALPPLTNSSGQPTGAIFGMINMLRRLLREYQPARIAVVFDAPGKTFREEMYAEYKAHRDETPEDLSAQFDGVVEAVQALGLPLLQVPGVEADDVIGTLARQAEQAGHEVLIVTSDKDMAQLVDARVQLLDTMKNRRLDPAGVEEKFGVPPERIIDYLALVGDTSDNIPGVPLVGPKTAAKWLTQYGSLDGIVAHAAEITGKAGDNLRDCIARDQLALAQRLATIDCAVQVPVALDALRAAGPDIDRLRELYRRFEFNRLLEELNTQDHREPPAEAAAAEAQGAPSAQTEVRTVFDEAGLQALLHELGNAPLICLDTETDSLDAMRARLVGLSFATVAGHGWYLPVGHDYLGAPEQLGWAAVRERLKPLLENPGKPKLGQHIKYDLKVLGRCGIDVQGVVYDTMLESYVLDAVGNRHDMDTLAEKYLNHRTIHYEDVAGKGKNQVTFNQVPVDKAAAYAAEDADITLRLHETLYPRVAEVEPLQRVFAEIEMPLVPVLADMERAGMKVDTELLARISGELAQRMNELQAQAFEQAGGPFNLGSPKQLQAILYDKLQLPVLGKTPKGEPSTAEDVLEELAAQHPLPRLILDWRSLSKLRSTYADSLPLQVNPDTRRIHTSYHQAVAATGRLSSSDPNLQNIPIRTAEGRRIREAFIAEAGNALLAVDYSQIELRLMAHLSGDARLRDAFAKGLDVHQATAAEVFGTALDSVAPEQRRAAKAINFGLIYGMSAFGLARQLGIGRGEAQSYMDTFFARYPGVKRYMEETRALARECGYVETLYGRRLYLRDIRSRNAAARGYAERTAINAPLQGTAADLIKLAMIDLHAWLAGHVPQLRMILQVHDELVFEGPAATVAEAAQAVADRMCRVHRLAAERMPGVPALEVPLVANWGIGANWDRSHDAGGAAQS